MDDGWTEENAAFAKTLTDVFNAQYEQRMISYRWNADHGGPLHNHPTTDGVMTSSFKIAQDIHRYSKHITKV